MYGFAQNITSNIIFKIEYNMIKKIAKGFSPHFKSFSVCGDKITIHKCVIDAAIKQVKKDIDPFEYENRSAGRLDILEELLDAIIIGMSINRNKI